MRILNLSKLVKDKEDGIDELIILSLCQSLYTVRVVKNGEYFKIKKRFKDYRAFSVGQIHKDFEPCKIKKVTMVQDSPYDEMIGHPPKFSDNTIKYLTDFGISRLRAHYILSLGYQLFLGNNTFIF